MLHKGLLIYLVAVGLLLGCTSAPKPEDPVTRLPGVGPEVTACILLFGGNEPTLECSRPLDPLTKRMGCLPFGDLEALYVFWETRCSGHRQEREPANQ